MNSRPVSILLTIILLVQAPLLFAIHSPDAAAAAPSPVKWQKYANNPVLSLGPSGSWDDDWILVRSVFKDGDEFKMYYAASDGAQRAIGLATSPDGKTWTKYAGNPIMLGDGAGTWCSNRVLAPCVILEGGVYNMWFIGSDGSHARMGFASSTDGINFNKYGGNPILDVGPSGSWEQDLLDFPMVLHENNLYKVWYVGQYSGQQRIGYATSPDGLSWTKYAGNPVFDIGQAGQWDDEIVSTPCILNISGTLRMWHSGYSGTNWAIGYATSDDGVHWTRYAHNPIMTREGNGFESGHNLCPVVIYNGTSYRMWYTGASTSFTTYGFGYAEGYNQIPNAPVLIAPYNDNWAANSTPKFSWTFSDPNPYDNQTAYQIQLDDSPDFSSVDYDSGKNASTFSAYTPPAPIPDGIYNWRARVWDSDGDNSTWSSPWKIKIDMTGPLNPIGLWSRSHTIGQWSNDNTIDVNWSLPDGGALISGYDSVSVEWDTSCSTVPDTVPELISDVLSATSPPMPDGDSIYFHVRAKDRAGNWAAGAAHLGPFCIDTTPPQNPAEVVSPSHEPMQWSNDSTMDMTWSDANDGLSGVAGYSFVWDNNDYTTPPTALNVSAGVLGVSSSPLADGNEWYFHLRTKDNAGNWALSTVHRGPYYIDTNAPAILNFSVNGGAGFSSCRTARAILRAEDAPGGSGLSGIRHRFNDGAWSEWENFNESFFFDMTGGDRQWTVEVQVRDAANNTSPTATATLLLDTGAPVVTGIQINQGANFTNSTSVVLSISIEDPSPSSGLDAMSLSADGKNWDPWESLCQTRPYNLTTGDGNKTVFVRSRDRAGNIGPAASATIILDTAPPVTFIPLLPTTVDDLEFTVNWTGADGTSGVSSFDVQYSDDGGAWTDWLLASKVNSAVFSGVDDHNYSFRARARDKAGNLENYPSTVKNSVLIDIPRPVVSITQPTADSILSGAFTFKGASFHPKTGLSVVRVQIRIDNGSWLDAKGTASWSFPLDTDRLSNGDHLITVRAFDGTKYSAEETREFSVKNETALSLGTFPLLILVILLIVAIIAGAFLVARRKRPAPAETPLPPEAVSPPMAGPPPAPPKAPPPVPPAQMAVVGKVSASDLDDEEVSLPAGLAMAPMAEPAPDDRPPAEAGGPLSEEPPAPRIRDETAMREGKILKSLSSLPRGLPSSLWGLDMEDLASKVVSGERKDSPDGDQLVKIGNHWYYGDETNLGLFMQVYKK